MKFLRLLVLALFCTCKIAYSQDIHFTQFYTSPLTLNPAFTGDYSGDYRFMNLYRSQWSSFDPGYITNAFGYDRQFYVNNDKLSAGLNIVYDKSGINALKVTKINLSAAYHKWWGKNNVHFGIQGGYILKAFDVSKLTFPDQFNNNIGYFDGTLVTTDAGINDHTNYIDLNAGFSWNHKYGKHTPKIGFAVFHINQPQDRFFKANNKLPMRNVITLADKWEMNSRIYITPMMLYMEQIEANDLMFGGTVTKKVSDNQSKITSINAGVFSRNSFNSQSDALALVAGFNYNHFDFGFSYDINISDLDVATNKHGAFEISIIYTAINTRILKVKIPCDRY